MEPRRCLPGESVAVTDSRNIWRDFVCLLTVGYPLIPYTCTSKWYIITFLLGIRAAEGTSRPPPNNQCRGQPVPVWNARTPLGNICHATLLNSPLS
jgi:hypothetical protein